MYSFNRLNFKNVLDNQNLNLTITKKKGNIKEIIKHESKVSSKSKEKKDKVLENKIYQKPLMNKQPEKQIQSQREIKIKLLDKNIFLSNEESSQKKKNNIIEKINNNNEEIIIEKTPNCKRNFNNQSKINNNSLKGSLWKNQITIDNGNHAKRVLNKINISQVYKNILDLNLNKKGDNGGVNERNERYTIFNYHHNNNYNHKTHNYLNNNYILTKPYHMQFCLRNKEIKKFKKLKEEGNVLINYYPTVTHIDVQSKTILKDSNYNIISNQIQYSINNDSYKNVNLTEIKPQIPKKFNICDEITKFSFDLMVPSKIKEKSENINIIINEEKNIKNEIKNDSTKENSKFLKYKSRIKKANLNIEEDKKYNLSNKIMEKADELESKLDSSNKSNNIENEKNKDNSGNFMDIIDKKRIIYNKNKAKKNTFVNK